MKEICSIIFEDIYVTLPYSINTDFNGNYQSIECWTSPDTRGSQEKK